MITLQVFKLASNRHCVMVLASPNSPIGLPARGNSLSILEIFNYNQSRKILDNLDITLTDDTESVEKAYQMGLLKRFIENYPRAVCLFNIKDIPASWDIIALDFFGNTKTDILHNIHKFMIECRNYVSQSYKDSNIQSPMVSQLTGFVEKYRQMSLYLGDRYLTDYKWVIGGLLNSIEKSHPDYKYLSAEANRTMEYRPGFALHFITNT